VIKFDVKHKLSGEVLFTAEIDCKEEETTSVKLGLAVKWGVENSANLSSADLSFADLRSANLRSANLRSADLRFADLRSANLSSADLRSADLRSADLRSADLSSADLRSANLRSANLRSADLSSADLRSANLRFANLRSVNLLVLQTDVYMCYIQKGYIRIGCEHHTVKEWWGFKEDEIESMDGEALTWWKTWKPIIKKMHKNFNWKEDK